VRLVGFTIETYYDVRQISFKEIVIDRFKRIVFGTRVVAK